MNKKETIAVLERLERARLPVGHILGEIDKAISRGNDIVTIRISVNEVDFSKQIHSERLFPYSWRKEVIQCQMKTRQS